MEAGQVIFHSIEHFTEHKLEPINIEENAQIRDNPDPLPMLIKKRLPPTNRNTGIFKETIHNQLVQKPNGTLVIKLDRDQNSRKAIKVLYLRERLPTQFRTPSLLQYSI